MSRYTLTILVSLTVRSIDLRLDKFLNKAFKLFYYNFSVKELIKQT